MNKTIASVLILATTLSCSQSLADITLYDIDGDPDAWAAAIGCDRPKGTYDFDDDNDYGIQQFDGPLTSAGAGPVSSGILPDGFEMNRLGFGHPGLVAVGPSAGFGNASNAILANFFVDAFVIDLQPDPGDAHNKAYTFNALTLLGSGTVHITAFDGDGHPYIFGHVHVGTGRNLGLMADDGESISKVVIFDHGGGAEGIQGVGKGFPVPEPSAALLLGFLVVGTLMTARGRVDHSAT